MRFIYPGNVIRHMFCSKLLRYVALEQNAKLFPETCAGAPPAFFSIVIVSGPEKRIDRDHIVGTIISFFKEDPLYSNILDGKENSYASSENLDLMVDSKKIAAAYPDSLLPGAGIIVHDSIKDRRQELEDAKRRAILMVESLSAQQEQTAEGQDVSVHRSVI